MVYSGDEHCPICNGELIFRDRVKRIVRTKYRETRWIFIRRLRCMSCRVIHRELPNDILPYKQYEEEIIKGVIENLITPDTIGFEDYPCEKTMERWKASSQFLQLSL